MAYSLPLNVVVPKAFATSKTNWDTLLEAHDETERAFRLFCLDQRQALYLGMWDNLKRVRSGIKPTELTLRRSMG